MFENVGEMVVLFWQTLVALPLTWRQRQKVFDQFFEIGNASLLMVCILSFFIGGVIALQTGPLLVERSLANAVGGVVGISICRELAPVMMSILIAGRIGSAMAAEIGSMRVYQEIDALRTMNISPIHYLVLPRLVAIAVSLPLLVIFLPGPWQSPPVELAALLAGLMAFVRHRTNIVNLMRGTELRPGTRRGRAGRRRGTRGRASP